MSRSMIRLVLFACAASPCAAQLTQFAQTGQEYLPDHPESRRTHDVVLADLDGDGDLDLVVAEGTDAFGNVPAHVATWFNDGAGRFDFAQVLWMNDGTRLPNVPIAVFDPDRDGDLDVWIADALAINDGTGRFPPTVQAGPGDLLRYAFAVGDVDGDGDDDLLDASNIPSGCALLQNDGSGGFSSTTNRLARGQAAAFFDADGDLDLDLVVAVPPSLTTPGHTLLYDNDGNGNFVEVSTSRYPRIFGSTFVITPVDVDGDSDADLVLGNTGTNVLLENVGSGTFVDATSGRLATDAVRTNAIEVLDVDGDGRPDLLFGEFAAEDRIHRNDGTGRFLPVTTGGLVTGPTPTRGIAIGDVDGDTRPDLVFGNEGRNTLHFGIGSGAFTLAGDASMPAWLERLLGAHLFDADGDGDLDLVTADFALTREQLFRNDGTGRYRLTIGTLPDDGNFTYDVDSGDFDGDGDADLLLASGAYGLALYLNDGTGRFTDASSRLPLRSGDARETSILDIDNDGDLDAYVRYWAGSASRILINDGTARFTDEGPQRLPSGIIAWRLSHDFADLDGDGDLDLFLPGLVNRVLINDGTGHFIDVSPAALPAAGLPFATNGTVGDVDGDGDIDGIIGDALLLNDGRSLFTLAPNPIPRATAMTAEQTLVDVDEDGDLDLVVVGPTCELLRNDGSGNFTSTGTAGLPADATLAQRVEIGDVDGDGDVDLVIVGEQHTRIYRNRQRQLATPITPRLGEPWRLDVFARPGYGVAGKTAFAAIASTRRGTPLTVPGLGTWHLDPATTSASATVAIAAGGGVASLGFAIPNVATLRGVQFVVQGGVLDPDGPSGFTNWTADVVR